MYKKYFFLFLSLFTIPSLILSAEIRKEYCVVTPVIENGRVIISGCNTIRESFAPSVVELPIRLLLPKGHKVVSFTVQYENESCLPGSHYLKPYRFDGRMDRRPPADYLTTSSPVYNRAEFYPPRTRSENSYTMIKCGNRIFITTAKPVQYNPVTGVVRYYKKVSVNLITEDRGLTRDPMYRVTPFIKSQLMYLVDNPETIDELENTPTGADDYQYLIITTDALKSGYNTFIDFNKRRALRTKLQTMEWIKSNQTGTDDADKLRNYIKSQYTNNGITFVLLGQDGDGNVTDNVPHRGFRAWLWDYGKDYTEDKDIAADMYYSCLDGTWKVSGSSYYGEYGSEDIGCEVHASRFPADNATELTNIMNKTMKYTETPVADQINKNILAGEYAWGPPDHPVECWGINDLRHLKGTSTKYGYTTVGFPSSWMNKELDDKTVTWTKTTFINTVRDNKVTWINHVGHSNNTLIMKLYSSDVTNTNFTNNGTNANFFLGSTIGCFCGSWDNKSTAGGYTGDCIAEQFTVGISNGAVGFISNTRFGLGDDGNGHPGEPGYDGSDGSNIRFCRYFNDAIFGKKMHYLEMMNGYSKEANVSLIAVKDENIKPYFNQMKYVAYEINVLGDPALSVWTENPTTLTADHPTGISSNATSYVWDTKKAYTAVALLAGDSILGADITGEDGKCTIDDPALLGYVKVNSGKTLKINVKAHNYLLYSGSVQIGDAGIVSFDKNVHNARILFAGNAARILYTLPVNSMVKIAMYNSKGILMRTLVNENQGAGEHTAMFDKSNLSNGIYYCEMAVDNNKAVKKFTIAR